MVKAVNRKPTTKKSTQKGGVVDILRDSNIIGLTCPSDMEFDGEDTATVIQLLSKSLKNPNKISEYLNSFEINNAEDKDKKYKISKLSLEKAPAKLKKKFEGQELTGTQIHALLTTEATEAAEKAEPAVTVNKPSSKELEEQLEKKRRAKEAAAEAAVAKDPKNILKKLEIHNADKINTKIDNLSPDESQILLDALLAEESLSEKTLVNDEKLRDNLMCELGDHINKLSSQKGGAKTKKTAKKSSKKSSKKVVKKSKTTTKKSSKSGKVVKKASKKTSKKSSKSPSKKSEKTMKGGAVKKATSKTTKKSSKTKKTSKTQKTHSKTQVKKLSKTPVKKSSKTQTKKTLKTSKK